MITFRGIDTPNQSYDAVITGRLRAIHSGLGLNATTFCDLASTTTPLDIILTKDKISLIANNISRYKALPYSKQQRKILHIIKKYLSWISTKEWNIYNKAYCFGAKLIDEKTDTPILRLYNKTDAILRKRFMNITGGSRYGEPQIQGYAQQLRKGGMVWTNTRLCPGDKWESLQDTIWRRLIYLGQCLAPNARKCANLTHIDGWENGHAFGSDLTNFYEQHKGLHRHALRIDSRLIKNTSPSTQATNLEFVPGREEQQLHLSHFSMEELQEITKRLKHTGNLENIFAGWDYNIINFKKGPFRDEWIKYQSEFSTEDIRYDCIKAILSIFNPSTMGKNAKKRILRYALYALYNVPFTNRSGKPLGVDCSIFQAYLLTVVEHKLRLSKLLEKKHIAADTIPSLPQEIYTLREELKAAKNSDTEKAIRCKLQSYNKIFAKAAMKWANELVNNGKYDELFQDIVFRFDPRYMTPSSLYQFLATSRTPLW